MEDMFHGKTKDHRPSADGFNEGIERGEGNRGTGRFPSIDRDFRPLRITHGVGRFLDESERFVESSNNFICPGGVLYN